MTMHRVRVGQLGESIATKYLQKIGFSVVGRNVRTRWAELDIIAQKQNSIRFIEVKTRIGTEKGKPYEAVNKKKLQNLKRATQQYLLKNKLWDYKLSLDIVSVELNADFSLKSIHFFEHSDSLFDLRI